MAKLESMHEIGLRSSRTCIGPWLSCLFVFVCLVMPSLAQRPPARRQSTEQVSSQTDGSGLSLVARNSLDAAVAALQSNALAEAERNARAAVKAAPRSAITHNVLGVVLDRSGRSDEAYNEFNASIKLDPNFVGARNNLGRILAERGQTDAAITEFERVLKTDSAHVQAHYNLGTLYGDTGNFVKAAECCQRDM